MASWLKAAEGILEVVDRRAKLVAGETSEEQTVPGTDKDSNRQGSQTKRARPKAKKKLSSSDAPTSIDIKRIQTVNGTSLSQAETYENVPLPLGRMSESSPIGKTHNNEQHKQENDVLINDASLSGTISNNAVKPVGDHLGEEASFDLETMASNSKGDVIGGSFEDKRHPAKDIEVTNGDTPVDSNQDLTSIDEGFMKNNEVSEGQTQNKDELPKTHAQNLLNEPGIRNKDLQEQEAVSSAVKVQEQLEEAQGLLKSTVSTGQSKEARLARVCAGLSSRLQEYKSENAQLEELLVAEKELSKSYEAHIKQLKKDLSASKEDGSRVEANMAEALSAKNDEIESLVSSIDALKKQAALAEGNLASLQETMESIMRNRELAETRMLQALREELAAAERRAEEEHSAHNAAKLAAREREVELEQRAVEASAALAKIQRTADDRASKAAELEQKVALLEVECATLNQELQDMETRIRREQKKYPEDANQIIQVQAWQEEVERARQCQREAESKHFSMEAEVQKMRVEIAAMKRDAEHYSRQKKRFQVEHISVQEHIELEKRYRELTDLLYYKQTQLETMASEKAAAEFQLEKQIKRIQEAHLEAERSRASHRVSASWDDDPDMKALEPLPLYHRHLAGAGLQIQKAAKLLDNGAVRATRFLWRYPIARVTLLFYLVFVHLFLMYLLHHLQEQADNYTSKEIAESMGLMNRTLP